MATNFVANGDTLNYTNEDVTGAVAIASGDGVLVGSIFGVAQADIEVGDTGALSLIGVWQLPKVSAQAWTLGAPIYWAVATSNATSTVGSNKFIGYATAAAANPSATGLVRLSN